MYTCTIHRHPFLKKTVLGLMAVLYFAGLLGLAHHQATTEHHHHGEQASVDHQESPPALTYPANALLAADDHDLCCQHVHDAQPTILPHAPHDILSKKLTRHHAAPSGQTATIRPARPCRQETPDVSPPVLAGVTTVAAGRAPPCLLLG